MESDKNEVRKAVIQFLKEQYNQKKLAKKAKVSHYTLSRFLSGDNKVYVGDEFIGKLKKAISNGK